MDESINVQIATKVIIFMAEHGLLRHNQLYDVYHDMDTDKTYKTFTIETIAMIDGISQVVGQTIINLNDLQQ